MTRGRGRGAGRLWKRGRTWVLDYVDEDGKRRREALGTRKRDAEELQAEIITRRNRVIRGLEVVAEDVVLDELRKDYLSDLRARVTARHLLNVSQQLALVLTAIPAETVLQLRPRHFLSYRSKMKSRGLSNRCCNVHLQAIRGMLNWALKLEIIERNPLAGITKLPEGKKHQVRKRRALTEAELERFLAAAGRYDELYGASRPRVPQAPMWRCLVDTGMRFGELRQLAWADFDAIRSTLHLRAENTKAGSTRLLPIRRDLVQELSDLRAIHWQVTGRRPSESDAIFLSPLGTKLSVSSNNPRRPFNRLLSMARIEPVDGLGQKVDIHALRHTFISRLGRAGVSLVHAQKLAGHSDPKLTAQVYTHLNTEDLRAAIDMLPGGSSSVATTPNSQTNLAQ